MVTKRRAVEWTLTIGVVVAFILVPWLRDHRSVILLPYFAVVTTVGLIRAKPEGIRFLVGSIVVALLAIALAVLALWVNIWLGLVFIVTVPTAALVVAYRRDQRAANALTT